MLKNPVLSKKKAFTLIEMLVVVGMVALISTFSLNFLTSVLKGNSKTTVTNEIKQNGSHALDIMSFYIRNARNISCPSASTLTVTQWDSSQVTFGLVTNPGLNGKIASAGADLNTNPSNLTNDDMTTGVNVSSLVFDCNTAKSPPTVNINFVISQSLGSQTGAQNQASATFETTVSLRTY